MLERRPSPQTIAWFVDLFHGKQLDLDPPYQRRSVWNTSYKQYFIDTILKNYPSPQIFLDVEITRGGRTIYHVVDGKQRLSAILNYMNEKFSTSQKYSGATPHHPPMVRGGTLMRRSRKCGCRGCRRNPLDIPRQPHSVIDRASSPPCRNVRYARACGVGLEKDLKRIRD